jgi:hypothetical protein
MAMERVTIEQNGEQFVLEVPEGTTDQQIQAFVAQQQGGAAPAPQPLAMTQAPVDPMENVGTYAMQSLLPAAIGGPEYAASSALRNLQSGLINAGISPGPMPNMTQTIKPGVVSSNAAEMAKRLYSLKDLSLSGMLTDIGGTGGKYATPGRGITGAVTDALKYVTEPLGGRATVGGIMSAAPRALIAGAMAPENLFTLPYNMAAYEQAKIRQNPNAPGLEFNPYAQTVRGEAATQARAGAANQMRTVANMPYGNVTPEERAMLDEDARIRSTIRKKALEKVMGPVAPGSF